MQNKVESEAGPHLDYQERTTWNQNQVSSYS